MGKRRIFLVAIAGLSVLSLLGGCTPYVEKKRAAKMKWDKVSARAKVKVAADLFANGRYEDAYSTVRECLASDPGLAEGHLLVGKIHYVYGRLGESESSLIKAVGYNDQLDEGWYWLGEIAQSEKTPAEALEYFDRAIALKPANTDYIVAVVKSYAAMGRYEEALDLLEKKMEILPGNTVLKVTSADISQRLGRTDEAILLYRQAMLLKPDSVDISESLGYCYITQQKWNEAARMFERVSAEAEGDKKKACLELLAVCSMNGGQYGKAVGYYNQLSVDQRNNENLWLQMGQAALGANAPRRAAACAARALALRPGWDDAIALKGCAQYLNNDYDTAIRTFSAITTSKKTGGFAWLMSGRCYQQLGQRSLADKAYHNASQLNPDSKLVTLLSKSQ